jgi:hypothetical protein
VDDHGAVLALVRLPGGSIGQKRFVEVFVPSHGLGT